MSQPLDPITLVPGQGQNIQLPNASNIQAVLLSNKSSYDLIVDGLEESGPRWHTAGTENLYVVAGHSAGKLSLSVYNNANISNPPSSIALGTIYLKGEKLPPGSWPVSIPTQTVSATVSNVQAQTLVNDGNAQTTIIESTPSGATSSTISIDNEGNVTIKSINGSTVVPLLQLIAGASPAVKLFTSGYQVEALGNLWADGFAGASSGIYSNNGAYYGTDGTNTIIQATGTTGTGNTRLQNTDHISLQVPGGTEAIGINSSQVTIEKSLIFNGQLGVSAAADVIDASNLNDTYIKARNTGNIIFQQPNGTTVGKFDSSGQLNLTHSLVLVGGTIGQYKIFSGTGNGTVATGVSNPTAITLNPCTVSGSSQTIGATVATSSVVTTGAGLAWQGTAYHS